MIAADLVLCIGLGSKIREGAEGGLDKLNALYSI